MKKAIAMCAVLLAGLVRAEAPLGITADGAERLTDEFRPEARGEIVFHDGVTSFAKDMPISATCRFFIVKVQ